MPRPIEDLLNVMAALRDPQTGCPWDVKQNFATIAPYTIEEAYEVADAIERGDIDDLRDELGDLLLQVVFHARMAEEAGDFAFGDVVAAIHDKMVRRHPHVFGDGSAEDAQAVRITWEEIKAEERAARTAHRAARGIDDADASLLDEVPRALPALLEALKLQKRAARTGFDWPDIAGARAKLQEELAEMDAVLADGAGASDSQDRLAEEIGDALFSLVNIARKAGVDPETALRACNAKVRRRFAHVETRLAAHGIALEEAGLDRMDALWDEAKAIARAEPSD